MGKASIDLGLSIGMIVIVSLIICGLAVVFVLHVFDFANEKFPDKAPDVVFHASADNPLYLEKNEVKFAPGENARLTASVYNPGWTGEDDIIVIFEGCVDADGFPVDGITLASVSQNIDYGSDKGYVVIIKAGKQVPAGDYICMVNAGVDAGDGFLEEDYPVLTSQLSVNVI